MSFLLSVIFAKNGTNEARPINSKIIFIKLIKIKKNIFTSKFLLFSLLKKKIF